MREYTDFENLPLDEARKAWLDHHGDRVKGNPTDPRWEGETDPLRRRLLRQAGREPIARCGAPRKNVDIELRWNGTEDFGSWDIATEGLDNCDNAWLCPRCAPRQRQPVSEELQMVIGHWIEAGNATQFVTLTATTRESGDIKRKQAAITKHFHAVTSKGAGPGWKRRHRIKGIYRVLEILWKTEPGSEGWNVHLHLLLTLEGPGDMTEAEIREAMGLKEGLDEVRLGSEAGWELTDLWAEPLKEGKTITTKWGEQTLRAEPAWTCPPLYVDVENQWGDWRSHRVPGQSDWCGHCQGGDPRKWPYHGRYKDRRQSQHARRVTSLDDEAATGYLAKVKESGEWTVGQEMSRGDLKKSRQGALTPQALLMIAHAGNEAAKERFVHLAEGIKNVNWRSPNGWMKAAMKEAREGLDDMAEAIAIRGVDKARWIEHRDQWEPVKAEAREQLLALTRQDEERAKQIVTEAAKVFDGQPARIIEGLREALTVSAWPSTIQPVKGGSPGLDEYQEAARQLAMTATAGRPVAIGGGPGSGKTRVLAAIGGQTAKTLLLTHTVANRQVAKDRNVEAMNLHQFAREIGATKNWRHDEPEQAAQIIANNPTVLDRWQRFLLDEAQDANKGQQAMMDQIIRNKAVVMAGDPHQAIFRFTDDKGDLDWVQRWCTPDRTAWLAINHRSTAAIINETNRQRHYTMQQAPGEAGFFEAPVQHGTGNHRPDVVLCRERNEYRCRYHLKRQQGGCEKCEEAPARKALPELAAEQFMTVHQAKGNEWPNVALWHPDTWDRSDRLYYGTVTGRQEAAVEAAAVLHVAGSRAEKVLMHLAVEGQCHIYCGIKPWYNEHTNQRKDE